MMLQVLVVEDTPSDLKQIMEDLPPVFKSLGVDVALDGCGEFSEAFKRVSNPLRRYDLIVSDTYDGPTVNRDAHVVLDMVQQYRGQRFCPIVVYSSGVQPEELKPSDFVKWADKGKAGGIEEAIRDVLGTGVPQVARKLHDELDQSAGSFLWGFLEKNWEKLASGGKMSAEVLERLIRRRAAAQIGDMEFDGTNHVPILKRVASEYYIYPRLHRDFFSLGDVLRHKTNRGDFRVILTPHCHLFKQPEAQFPRADHVLLLKTVDARQVLGEKVANTKKLENETARHDKLETWSRSPAQTGRKPDGRHWYLPAFLDIPHLYCDFLQIESIPYDQLDVQFEPIATLVAPYAEALQACFAGFYSSVGIPELRPKSIEDLLN